MLQAKVRRIVAVTALLLCCSELYAQDAQEAPGDSKPAMPTIADEPHTIDPVTLMPPELRASATHDFTDSSLREVVDWLAEEHNLVVLVDNNALVDIGVSPAEPISDRLNDSPIYLLLNRLRTIGLGWYFEDEVLHITSIEEAEGHETTLPYNVGDLLDGGYTVPALVSVITDTIAPTTWDIVGGSGSVIPLGDVLLVRQTDELQHEIQGLLAALRSHGRQTFTNDPSQNLALRSALDEDVSVDFVDTPLAEAVGRLAQSVGVDIRLDVPTLRDNRVREREPVTLKLTQRSLETVLQAMLLELKLTWVIRDGVLWITSKEEAEGYFKTAVYDVRDLCRDAAESASLENAVESQLEPTSWDIVGGEGAIVSAKPGTLVVSHRERVQMQLLNLLETYRAALRSSKPRQRPDDSKKIATVYYRTYTKVATDLAVLLPAMVQPESWRSDSHPDAPGNVLVVASEPDVSNLTAKSANVSEANQAAPTLVTERSVLIITQTRAAHDEIAEIIRRVESGDSPASSGGFGGGLGGGGFGGGFFNMSAEKLHEPSR